VVGKVAGLIPVGQSRVFQGFTGIGYARRATQGKLSGSNAHPQTESFDDFALVHNGNVENIAELKQCSLARGHQFTSETDTEVIAQLIEKVRSAGPYFEDSFGRLGEVLKNSQAMPAMLWGEVGNICVLRWATVGDRGGLPQRPGHRGRRLPGRDAPVPYGLLCR
jgi:glucosamine--fructose-6-phosphate aminotransferase (isomerizing)